MRRSSQIILQSSITRFLNQRYVDNLIATTPSGMFTERGIYGRWVIGEGAVYRDFKEDMYIKQEPENFAKIYAGVDWGL